MKTYLSALALTAGALSLSACASMMGGNLVEDGKPVGRITVVNNSRITMNVVTISQCSAMSHGLNRLNSGESIPGGYSRSWTVSAGCYDIGVGNTGGCSQDRCSWAEAYKRVQVSAGGTMIARWN